MYNLMSSVKHSQLYNHLHSRDTEQFIPYKVPSADSVVNPCPCIQPLANTDLLYLSVVLSSLGCLLILIF